MAHMNESWHKWMSHHKYECVMAPMNESWHIWTSHGTYEWSLYQGEELLLSTKGAGIASGGNSVFNAALSPDNADFAYRCHCNTLQHTAIHTATHCTSTHLPKPSPYEWVMSYISFRKSSARNFWKWDPHRISVNTCTAEYTILEFLPAMVAVK